LSMSRIKTHSRLSAFQNPSSLFACTLLGTVIRYALKNDVWDAVWMREVQQLDKVNAMQVQGEVVVVGGFDAAGKGVVEVWQISESD
jgi:hypothetical protein